MPNKTSRTIPVERFLVVDNDGDIVYTCKNEAQLNACLTDDDGLDEGDPVTLYVYTLTKSVTLVLETKVNIKETAVK